MNRLARSPPSGEVIKHTVSDSDVSNIVDHEACHPTSQRIKKRPRETRCEDQLLKFKEEVKSMIKDMTERQTLILNKLVNDVTEIKAQNSSIQQSNQEIEKSIQFLSDRFDNMSARVETLERERKEHLLHISSLEAKVEDMHRTLKSTTVEIRNVPCQSNKENKPELTGIVQNTCKALDVDLQLSDIKDVFRIKGKSGSSTVVVEFTRTSTKQEVVRNAKTYNKAHPNERLNSTIIGLAGKSVPIFVSEGLTNKGRRILYLARDFASTSDYKYCWTSNGKVYLRKSDDSPHIEIKNETDLVNLKIPK